MMPLQFGPPRTQRIQADPLVEVHEWLSTVVWTTLPSIVWVNHVNTSLFGCNTMHVAWEDAKAVSIF